MKTIESRASFPDGFESLGYRSVSDISKLVVGRRIVSVEYVSECEIKFLLDNGDSVSLTPGGTEGDDLELNIVSIS